MSENKTVRHFVFFQAQWTFNIVVAILVAGSVLALQFMISNPEIRVSVTILLLVLAVIICCGQLLVNIRSFSYIITPLEKMQDVLKEWQSHLALSDSESVSIDKIKVVLQSLDSLLGDFRHRPCPMELKSIQTVFYHTLKMMQDVMEKASGDMVLMGLGNVCSQVAHDIRGPVSAIAALAAAIPKLTSGEDLRMTGQIIAQSAAKLTLMAEDLLNYRRATQIDIQSMDISQIVEAVVKELGVQAQKLGVAVAHDIQVSNEMRGDADKLSRVVQNLVQNSIQALSGIEGARVWVKGRQIEDKILLSVTDNGPGIPEAHMGQMFKRGFTTKGKNGIGLGLIYCETVIRGHGGKITACNLPEGGAEFSIHIPLQTAH